MVLANTKLFAPEFLVDEIEEHLDEIMEKSGLSKPEFALACSILFSRIESVGFEVFEGCLGRAKEICSDEDDEEYMALALAKNIGIWSDDKALKKQDVVRVYSTGELLDLLEG